MTGVVREIIRCRVCGNEALAPVCDLGNMAFTGIFPATAEEPVPEGVLRLVRCAGDPATVCGLVQLAHTFDPQVLFADGYGYRSATNLSMRRHLEVTARRVEALGGLSRGDVLLDIGSNDGTFLQAFTGRGIHLAGVDPLAEQFSATYPPEARFIAEFFSPAAAARALEGRKANVVTALAMFYDLDDPLQFLADIRGIMDPDGICFIELGYWPEFMKAGIYDMVCHEHIGYYGLRQIEWLARASGFEVIAAGRGPINGGSFHVVLALAGKRRLCGGDDLSLMRQAEAGGSGTDGVEDFQRRVIAHRDGLRERVRRGRTVGAYGASTKGNVVLQYCGFTPRDIPFVAEINPRKWQRFCPGTQIPIISEAEAMERCPDIFLVLPWHLRGDVLAGTSAFVRGGGRLFFTFTHGHDT